jgi:hypothetical protein
MSMKLLAASVNPVDPLQAPEASTGLVLLTQRAISARAGGISLVPSADAFAWSSSARRGEPNFIYGTPVEDCQSDETGPSGQEYVSGLAWGRPVESKAVAQYLFYAGGPAGGSGRLLDLYA